MPTSTMTSKGQTTVPKEVREALDLGSGDKLTWEVNAVVLSSPPSGRPSFVGKVT
jgi:AbrB family looped-hinge helix DNA binding protein